MRPVDKHPFKIGDREPDIEINKPGERKLWQRPQFTFWSYLLFIIASFYLWQSVGEMQREQIPYSEFLQHLEKDEIAEAIVTDRMIRGTLTLKDETSGNPRLFITVPLWNNELAQDLEKHKVKYSVRIGDKWFSKFLTSWVLPFGLLFLLWGWLGKRMAGGAKGLLNIGNRVHIHADTDIKVTFDDVAGVEDAKLELQETI